MVGIVVAIAKPWSDAGKPAASGPPDVAGSCPSAAASSSASALPASTALPTHLSHPLPIAFTTAPRSGSETWAGLEWQRLASDDPLRIVRSRGHLGRDLGRHRRYRGDDVHHGLVVDGPDPLAAAEAAERQRPSRRA